MNGLVRAAHARTLLGDLGVTDVTRVEVLHEWRLSAVARLHRRRGDTLIYKLASAPFTGEDRVLTHMAHHELPVPRLLDALHRDQQLAMLLDDLGTPPRAPGIPDAATAAVAIHQVPPPSWLPVWDETRLAALPEECAVMLDDLRGHGRYRSPDAKTLDALLARLSRVAHRRADGATRPPFGTVHGELHPSALHLGYLGWHVLDWAMTLHGPGLLDLAAWFGLRHPPNMPAARSLLDAYVHAGGHPDARAPRGGVPAETWTLAWHRIQSAHWLLDCAVRGIDGPDTDHRHLAVLHRNLTHATTLLDPEFVA